MTRQMAHGTNTIAKISKDMLRTPRQRQIADDVRLRLQWLEPNEKRLLQLYWIQAVPFNALVRIEDRPPSSLRHHLSQITDRLLHGPYAAVMRQSEQFTQHERKIAYDAFILGFGYRRIAQKRCIPHNHARKTLRKIKAWHQLSDTDTSQPSSPPPISKHTPSPPCDKAS